MDEFNEMSKSEQINALCDFHECNEKKRKIHFRQYVHKRWNPHPPRRFVQWWEKDGGAIFTEQKTGRRWAGVETRVAFNCEAVREAYREAKQVGLA